MLLRCPQWTLTDGGQIALGNDHVEQTPFEGFDIETNYCSLCPEGILVITSGFTFTPRIGKHGSIVPDALYACLRRLMADGWLPPYYMPIVRETYADALQRWDLSPLRAYLAITASG